MDATLWILMFLFVFIDYWEIFDSVPDGMVAGFFLKFYQAFLARYFVEQIVHFREFSLI